MHRKTRWLVAGLAAAALTGAVGMAAAKSAHLHTLTVVLPDGGVAEIRYAGEVAPQVLVSRAPPALAEAWAPTAFVPWDDPFAELDRIAAQMDRQAAVMLQQAQALESAAPGGPGPRFSYAANGAGSGVCGRSVEITSDGSGQAPKVVSRTWGDCAAEGPGAPVAAPAAQAKPADGLIRTGADSAAAGARKSSI